MTIFRSGVTPPAWCELEVFEIFSLALDEAVRRVPAARAERLLGTAGTVQLRRGGAACC